jgi:hypothetical protein
LRQLSSCLAVACMTAAALAAGAVTAPAEAGIGIVCATPTSQPFAPWGDLSRYAFMPDGGLEQGSDGWTLSGGAHVVAGNETFAAHATGDAHALSLPAGSSATTPAACIGLLSTRMRFFSRGSTGARLRVQAVYRGGLGQVLGFADAGTIAAGGAWHPTSAVTLLGGTLPLLTGSVSFRFSPIGTTGSWAIDDVYLDPLMHR